MVLAVVMEEVVDILYKVLIYIPSILHIVVAEDGTAI